MATVQSTVDTGHEDMVHDAQMDYYGTRLATCSSDKLVKIFEVKDGTQVLCSTVRWQSGETSTVVDLCERTAEFSGLK